MKDHHISKPLNAILYLWFKEVLKRNNMFQVLKSPSSKERDIRW
jgi:hypothetical protein